MEKAKNFDLIGWAHTRVRSEERLIENAKRERICDCLKNRVSGWVEDDSGELNEWAKATAQKLYGTFHAHWKDTMCHIEIEAARLMESVYGDDKSWRKAFHGEMNRKEFFTARV